MYLVSDKEKACINKRLELGGGQAYDLSAH
jgi:hypothetical protein